MELAALLERKHGVLMELFKTFKNPPSQETWYRFVPKIVLPKNLDDCWGWNPARERRAKKIKTHDYAVFADEEGKTRNVQRVWGIWRYGEEAIRDLFMDHGCNNPLCVNPYHLDPVTPWINANRPGSRSVTAANVAMTHCKNGHELTYENCIPSAWRRGVRTCQICRRDWESKRNYVRNRVAADSEIPTEELLARIKREKTHCKNGHLLTADNCVGYELRVGSRTCKTCRKDYHQERWKEKVRKRNEALAAAHEQKMSELKATLRAEGETV